MPRFLKQNDPSLSTLNKVKRGVNKKLKQQYELAPDDIVASADGAPAISGSVAPRNPAGGLASLLSDMETAIAEQTSVTTTIIEGALLALEQDRPLQKGSDVLKDLAGNASVIANLVKKGGNLLASASYDLSGKLSQAELESSIASVKDISRYMREEDREVGRLDAMLRRNLSVEERIEVLSLKDAINRSNLRWVSSLAVLHEALVKALSTAKKSPAMRGGSYHAQNVFGGALVQAYQSHPSGDRELLTCGYTSREPLVPLIQTHASRDRMDLVGLPRRFL